MQSTDEIAVSLRYNPGSGQLPHVSARGRGAIARQILAVAKANDVPVRQDAALASILGQLDSGSPIPVAAFAAVAEILAYLYSHEHAGRTPPVRHKARLP